MSTDDDTGGAGPDRAAREAMFEAVRRASKPAVWSRGVELVRASAVIGDRVEPDEAHFRISARGGMRSTRVALFTDDMEWDCECAAAGDTCEHVAAAAIAWRQSAERDEQLPGADVGRIGYRLQRAPNGLVLERVIVHPGGETPLRGSIAAHTQGRVPGPRLVASKTDLAVELALGGSGSGPIPRTRVVKLFASLSGCGDVELDGRAVSISRERISPRVCVEDRGGGFVLTIVPDPSIDEVFANEIGRAGEVLHPLVDPPLTGREREELGRGRYVPGDALAELVTTLIPALRRKLPVDVATDRLPATLIKAAPRAVLELAGEGAVLDVLPTIVYGDPAIARLDGDKLVPLGSAVPERDAFGERRAAARLRELGLSAGVRVTYEGEAAVAYRSRIERWDGDLGGDAAIDRFRVAAPLVPKLELRADGFDLEFVAAGGAGSSARGSQAGGRADPDAVLGAWRDGASLVPLLEGGWAPLPADWLERLGPLVADLLAARDESGRVAASSATDLATLHEALDEPVPPELDGVRALLALDAPVPPAELPDDLTATLRDYQRAGVDWLSALRDVGLGALLADDMGLGKTLQALCAIRGRTLVVAPTSVLVNWRDEIARHRPRLPCRVYHGKDRELDESPGVTLTSYALLRIDIEQLSAVDWDVVVLDESQQIKNPDSRVAQAAYRLRASWRVALTGTPVENRLDELWSQFHFLNPGLLGGRREFRDRVVTPIGAGDEAAAERLRARIRPFILRRLKTVVARELPPRTEVVLRCRLSRDEREAYDAIRAASLERVKQELNAGRTMAALETLLRLRQASCHLGLLPGQQADTSAKLALLLSQLENVAAEGRRALVFSQWTALLDRTQPLLDAAGIAWTRLDGSTRDRQAVVHGFQADDGPPVMLVSLKAGGTGLTLTAADHVFMLDPWWNPAVEDQAADRAHRIGQTRPVMIYRLIAEETVDERILALQDRKRELARAALGDDGDPAAGAGLTRDDLLALLD